MPTCDSRGFYDADAELALSMLIQMQEQGGERILKAIAEACKMFGQQRQNQGDWNEAGDIVSKAATLVEFGDSSNRG